jgi:hypothetical protein
MSVSRNICHTWQMYHSIDYSWPASCIIMNRKDHSGDAVTTCVYWQCNNNINVVLYSLQLMRSVWIETFCHCGYWNQMIYDTMINIIIQYWWWCECYDDYDDADDHHDDVIDNYVDEDVDEEITYNLYYKWRWVWHRWWWLYLSKFEDVQSTLVNIIIMLTHIDAISNWGSV